ncbi:PHP domain-containing protein [Methanoculleus sp. 10]|uniref:PHP domain-containing protein n=1 Tax=Methanoculleus sp. 10 TaxID=430615 RepID=UPI0025DBEBDD|nr:PHP domain-containing protein [Methanoculleus sp. 10]
MKLETYCFDLHIHSKYSLDSLLSPQKIIDIAYSRGLNAVSITDHNTIKGSVVARSLKQDRVHVIIGSEISTDYGDIIGLFLSEDIRSRVFEEVVDEIRDQDGIVVLPHPYRRKRFLNDDLLSMVDLLEGVNGRSSAESNQCAIELAGRIKKKPLSGSDSHFSFELGRMYNVYNGPLDPDDDAIRNMLLRENIQMYGKSLNIFLRKAGIYSSAGLKLLQNLSLSYRG